MRKSCLILLLLVMALLCGCGSKPAVENGKREIRFYYLSSDAKSPSGDLLSAETRPVYKSELTPAMLLGLYLKGSQTGLRSAFPTGAGFESIEISGTICTVNLDENASKIDGFSRTLAVSCLTNTLTQIPTVSGIRVHFYGDAALEPNSPIFRDKDFLLEDVSVYTPETEIALYYLDAETQTLKRESRTIMYHNRSELPEILMRELLKVPKLPNLVSAVPEGTSLASVSLSNRVCDVTFSKYFANCDVDEVTARNAVLSVVNTLCQLPEVDSVKLHIKAVSDLEYYSIASPIRVE